MIAKHNLFEKAAKRSNLFPFQRRKKILQQTRVSLEHIQTYYEEQRKRIEAQLDKRTKMAEDKENQSPISTSTSNSSKLTTSTSSTKESSGDDHIQRVGKKTQLRRTSHSATHRHFSLNKSR